MKAPAVTVAAVLLASCGYTAGLDLTDQGVRTVAIEVAGNETLRQRLEIPLTARVYELLPIHTNLRPAAYGSADAVLELDLQSVDGRSLVQGGDRPVVEGALLFEVHAVLRDRRSGAVLRDRTIRDRAEFRSPVGENESTAVAEATMDLARKIALALEPDF